MSILKSFVAIIVSGLVAVPAALAQGKPAEKISFRLEWTIGGYHAPFFLAQERGYYKAEGLDVEFLPGGGSQKTVSLIGNKSDMIGLADAGSLIQLAAQGLPVKMVGTIANVSQFAIISRADAGINVPKDLEGKKVALTPGSAHAALFPAVISAAQLNRSRITMINLDGAGALAAMLDKSVDAQISGVDGPPLVLAEKGMQTKLIRFADLGVNTIGRGFIVHEDTVKQNPAWLRKFLKASLRGWTETPKAIDEAVSATQKAQEATSRQSLAVIKQALEVNLTLVESLATKGKPIGYQAIEDWQTTLDLMKTYRDVKTERPASSFYTNDFLPK